MKQARKGLSDVYHKPYIQKRHVSGWFSIGTLAGCSIPRSNTNPLSQIQNPHPQGRSATPSTTLIIPSATHTATPGGLSPPLSLPRAPVPPSLSSSTLAGCSIPRSNTNPLSQIQTPHPQGESATPSTTLIIPSATHTATPGGLSPPLSLPRAPVPPSLSSSTLAGCSIPRSNTNPLSQIQTPHPQGESATPSTTLIIPSATHTATPGGLSPPLSLPRAPVPPSLSSSTLAGCSIPRSNTNPLSQIQTPHPQGESATPSTTLIIPSATHTATPRGFSPPLSLPRGPVPPSLSSSTLAGYSIPRSNTNPLSQIQTPHPQGESATTSTTLIIPSATHTATPGGLSPPLSLPRAPVPPSLSSSTLAGCSIPRSNTNPLSQIQTPHPQGESATPSTTLIIPSATHTATPGGLSPPLSLPRGPVPPSLSSSTLAGCSIPRSNTNPLSEIQTPHPQGESATPSTTLIIPSATHTATPGGLSPPLSLPRGPVPPSLSSSTLAGCSIPRSNTNPLSQIQTPHPQGESATPSTTLKIPSATHTATPGGLSPPLSLPRAPVPPSLSSSTLAGCSIPRSNTNPLSQIQTPHPQGESATPSTTLIIPSATHTATPGGLSPPLSLPRVSVVAGWCWSGEWSIPQGWKRKGKGERDPEGGIGGERDPREWRCGLQKVLSG